MSFRERKLISRPQSVIAAEQERHDRAQARALTAFFAALFVGGGVAMFIQFSQFFRGRDTLQAMLECVIFVGPLLVSFVALCRVPPPPFESLGEARRDREKKVNEWRAIIVSQIFVFALLASENLWFWPRLARAQNWMFALVSFAPMVVMVFLAVNTLYVRPGWLSPDLRVVLDDEVTWSFRARAQRLGYLLMLFIALGFCVLAQVNPRSAAHYLPLGLAAGIMLPLLYFVYLDWAASRGG
jgi:hypothetical protein